ncbi:MAG: cytochrome c oxidase subunit 3 [Terracidiphilus sp.]|jgi:cytochrome c oxidase subunit 3
MPSTITHTPAETERKEPGIGGKPPLDRRPTGGGGGGGDDEGRNQRGGPRELLHRVRFFVYSALAADMLFFAVLVLFFFARQAGMRMNPRTHLLAGDWQPMFLPPILYLNTAVLLLSSLTMERARQNIFREVDVLEEWLGLGRPALRRTLPWVAATLTLGAVFLTGQAMAWRQLTAQGFAFDRWSTPASYFFYVITGLHAAHLIIGIVALILCLSALGWLKRVEYRQIAVDSTAWFWHAMSLAWLLLLAVLAVGQ